MTNIWWYRSVLEIIEGDLRVLDGRGSGVSERIKLLKARRRRVLDKLRLARVNGGMPTQDKTGDEDDSWMEDFK